MRITKFIESVKAIFIGIIIIGTILILIFGTNKFKRKGFVHTKYGTKWIEEK